MNRRWIECALVAAIIAVIACFFWPSTGGVSYFSPDTLESRYQREVLLPGSYLPAYRSGYKAKESKLVEYLIETGYWSPIVVETPRWMVTGHFNHRWKDGQSYMHRALYWDDDEWVRWSEQNPARAAVLWPEVLTVLRKDLERGDSEVAELMWQAKN